MAKVLLQLLSFPNFLPIPRTASENMAVEVGRKGIHFTVLGLGKIVQIQPYTQSNQDRNSG